MNEDMHDLCVKAVTGELTPDERAEFETWRDSSDTNRAEFESWAQAWDNFPASPSLGKQSQKEDWQRLVQNLGIEDQVTRGVKWSWLFAPKLRPAFAGFAILLVALVILKGTGFFPFSGTPDIFQITAEHRIVKDFHLPDGSTVVLNRDSQIGFTDNLQGKERRVTLKGEAFFDVKHDERRPFIVSTPNGSIRVLGTRFNVWTRNNETRLILEQGRVELTSEKFREAQILKSGEMSRIVADSAPTQPIATNVVQHLGWMEGKLVFIKSTLNEVADELERYYDVRITVQDIALLRQTLTATFDNQPLETVLESICITLNAEYEKHADRVVIRKS